MAATKKQSSKVARQKPGSTGKGDYYHIEVLPKTGFVTFRTQDVGDPGHVQRVAGKKGSGSWQTVKWLIGKEDAHVSDDHLVGDTKDARDVIKQLGAPPVLVRGDRFKVKTRSAAGGPSKSRTNRRAQSKAKGGNV